MKKDKGAESLKLYCVIDRKRIPVERIIGRSVTCCKACQHKLRKIRLAMIESRRCRSCSKPSTPEERVLFRLFKTWAQENGHIPRPQRGRTPKKAVDTLHKPL